MLKLFSPGDLLSDALGLPIGESRVIFRMLINTMVWGAVGTGVMLAMFL